MCVCVCVCIYMYVCLCVCMYVCLTNICLHSYICLYWKQIYIIKMLKINDIFEKKRIGIFLLRLEVQKNIVNRLARFSISSGAANYIYLFIIYYYYYYLFIYLFICIPSAHTFWSYLSIYLSNYSFIRIIYSAELSLSLLLLFIFC